MNINIIKSLINSNNNNANEIDLLKKSILNINEIKTTNNIEKNIFKYRYTNHKLLTINYNILCCDDINIAVFSSDVIIKVINNTLIYPKFESKYFDENFENIKINVKIDDTYVYINVEGLDNHEINYKGSFNVLYY